MDDVVTSAFSGGVEFVTTRESRYRDRRMELASVLLQCSRKIILDIDKKRLISSDTVVGTGPAKWAMSNASASERREGGLR